MTILNLIVVNVAVWVGLSYFWSFWTHKVFKPWQWLELRKRKLINSRVERLERSYKDRVRLYAYFFAMEQVEKSEVNGEFLMLGIEETELLQMLRLQCPERTIRVMGSMAPEVYHIVRENCQGEISDESVNLDYAKLDEVRAIMPESGRNIVVQGDLTELAPSVSNPVALAMIDSVDYQKVKSCLHAAYDHLSKGGILIVHSYNHDWDGVRKAVDEFAAAIPEGFVPIPDMYGSVELVKS